MLSSFAGFNFIYFSLFVRSFVCCFVFEAVFESCLIIIKSTFILKMQFYLLVSTDIGWSALLCSYLISKMVSDFYLIFITNFTLRTPFCEHVTYENESFFFFQFLFMCSIRFDLFEAGISIGLETFSMWYRLQIICKLIKQKSNRSE